MGSQSSGYVHSELCTECECGVSVEVLIHFLLALQPSPGGASAPPTAPPSAALVPTSQQNSTFKLPIIETLDRVKDEFAVLQAQNQG